MKVVTGQLLRFDAPGIYTARVDFVDASIPDYLHHFAIDTVFNSNQRPVAPAGFRFVNPPSYSPNALFIEDTSSDNTFLEDARMLLPNAQSVSSTYDAIIKIQAAVESNRGLPIKVVMITHGGPSTVTLGSGINGIANPPVGQGLKNDNTDVEDFGLALQGQITSLTFFGCEASSLRGFQPGTKHLLRALSGRLKSSVSAYDKYVAFSKDKPGGRPRFFIVATNATFRTRVNGFPITPAFS